MAAEQILMLQMAVTDMAKAKAFYTDALAFILTHRRAFRIQASVRRRVKIKA